MPYRVLALVIMMWFIGVQMLGTTAVLAAACPKGPCVTTTDIIDGQVTAPDLATDAVTGAAVLDGGLTGADIQEGTVQEGDLADAAVSARKLSPDAVGSREIADNAIQPADVGFPYAGSASRGGPASDLLCMGCVSKTELDFAVPGIAARRIVVASSGGDYSSISEALAAINPEPGAPYVIDVMPGTYSEAIVMKSYVHLRGAGREVTTIWAPSILQDAVTINTLSNVAISGFTIFGGHRGIFIWYSSPTIRDNTIYFNDDGIDNSSSSAIIEQNIIVENRNRGIVDAGSTATIRGNTIIRNQGPGIVTGGSARITGNIISENVDGLLASGSFPQPIISDNTVTNNQGFGIYASSAAILRNTIIGNGFDLMNSDGNVHISFNVYDTLGGITGTGRGQFNVTSSGGLAPAP